MYHYTLGLLSLGLLVTGLLYFIAFNAQYGLWKRRFAKDNNKKEKSDTEAAASLGKGVKQDREMNYLVE